MTLDLTDLRGQQGVDLDLGVERAFLLQLLHLVVVVPVARVRQHTAQLARVHGALQEQGAAPVPGEQGAK